MGTEPIDHAREQIDKAWLTDDADGITQYMAEDAILMPPNVSKIVGRQQINTWIRQFFEFFSMTELSMPEREVVLTGEWAFEVAQYEWTLVPKGGGEAVHDQVNWIGIWRLADGTWVQTKGMWNSSLPLADPN